MATSRLPRNRRLSAIAIRSASTRRRRLLTRRGRVHELANTPFTLGGRAAKVSQPGSALPGALALWRFGSACGLRLVMLSRCQSQGARARLLATRLYRRPERPAFLRLVGERMALARAVGLALPATATSTSTAATENLSRLLAMQAAARMVAPEQAKAPLARRVMTAFAAAAVRDLRAIPLERQAAAVVRRPWAMRSTTAVLAS